MSVMKILKTALVLASLALTSGCVAVPVADYPSSPDAYYYRPALPIFYGPSIDLRFGGYSHGRGGRRR